MTRSIPASSALALARAFLRDTVFHGSNIVARACIEVAHRRTGIADIYKLLRLSELALAISPEELAASLDGVREVITARPEVGSIDIQLQDLSSQEIIERTLRFMGTYHFQACALPEWWSHPNRLDEVALLLPKSHQSRHFGAGAMKSADTVGIVGAGPFGLALASMLGRAGRPVVLWSTTTEVVQQIGDTRRSQRMSDLELPETVVATKSPRGTCRVRTLLVVRSVLALPGLTPGGVGARWVDGHHIAVHAIGGLVEGDRRASELIEAETAILRIGVVAGPSMATEIAAGRMTSMVCASEFDEVIGETRRLLALPPLMRLYRGHDLVGVELASVLAGAYTISMGLADGLEVGIGARAVLVTRALAEMSCPGRVPRRRSTLLRRPGWPGQSAGALVGRVWAFLAELSHWSRGCARHATGR